MPQPYETAKHQILTTLTLAKPLAAEAPQITLKKKIALLLSLWP